MTFVFKKVAIGQIGIAGSFRRIIMEFRNCVERFLQTGVS